jgi:hypothetical protein
MLFISFPRAMGPLLDHVHVGFFRLSCAWLAMEWLWSWLSGHIRHLRIRHRWSMYCDSCAVYSAAPTDEAQGLFDSSSVFVTCVLGVAMREQA